jgi:hypothetical protein
LTLPAFCRAATSTRTASCTKKRELGFFSILSQVAGLCILDGGIGVVQSVDEVTALDGAPPMEITAPKANRRRPSIPGYAELPRWLADRSLL